MPFVNGTWVDDATSVPDPSMPQGMGDPTGAIVPAGPGPQDMCGRGVMAPQQINPTPMGPQRPTPCPPQIDPRLLDPAAAGIKLQDVSPPLTGEMVSQEWNRINRTEVNAGDVAKAIISSPLTVPIGIIEELRGLFGGDTVEGSAQQANDRYRDPKLHGGRGFGARRGA